MLDTQHLTTVIWDFDETIVPNLAYKYEGIWKDVFPDDRAKHESIVEYLATPEGQQVNRYGLIKHALIATGETELVGLEDDALKNHPLIAMYADVYQRKAIEGTVKIGMFPCIPQVISDLQLAGYHQYIISGGGSDDDLNTIAERLQIAHYFEAIYGFGDPKLPLVTFEKHANFLRVKDIEQEEDPATYIVIGDSESDWVLAQDIGCHFIGIATKWNGWQEEKTAEKTIIRYRCEISDLLS